MPSKESLEIRKSIASGVCGPTCKERWNSRATGGIPFSSGASLSGSPGGRTGGLSRAATGSRVGQRHQANTIGMQIAAAGLGAAVVPAIAGVFAGIYGLEAIPLFLLISIILLPASFVFSHAHSKK